MEDFSTTQPVAPDNLNLTQASSQSGDVDLNCTWDLNDGTAEQVKVYADSSLVRTVPVGSSSESVSPTAFNFTGGEQVYFVLEYNMGGGTLSKSSNTINIIVFE